MNLSSVRSYGYILTYSYDAWGKLLNTTDTSGANIGQINPFLYRGYYYDSETGLYSLHSRYYDPQTERFINADGQLNDDILGNNLFAYCGNNPVTRTDDSGHGWWIAAGAIIGGIVGGVTKVLTNVNTGKQWNDGVIGAVVGGAVYGGVLAATCNPIAAGFAGAAAESVTNQILSYTPLAKYNGSDQKKLTKTNVANSVGTFAADTAINGTISAVTGKIAGKIIPTNNGWIKPQKFVSSFAGNYAVKSELQTFAQSGLLFGVEEFKRSFSQRLKQGQQATVTFFPNTEIRAAG